ncbi:MAG: pentapeptide repeat-containing protein [Lysobacter sp.]|nr:MAG: pentapeptide repeat-containing protein [Lysobacter sp.]
MKEDHGGKHSSSEEIEKIKVEMIAQDHRVFASLARYFIESKKWEKDDPRHDAVKTALIYSIFSPAVIAVGGGGIAFISLIVLLWQNVILLKQNEIAVNQNVLIESQNGYLKEQISANNAQWSDQQRMSAISVLYDTKPCNNYSGKSCNAYGYHARVQALKNLYLIQMKSDACAEIKCKAIFQDVGIRFFKMSEFSFERVEFLESDLRNTDFFKMKMNGFEVVNTFLDNASFSNVEMKNCVIKNPFAEKPPVLSSSINVTYSSVDFYSANLQGCQFDGMISSHRYCFFASNLTESKFSPGSDMKNFIFEYSDLTGVDFSKTVGLNPKNIESSCSRGGTKLPFNMELKKCEYDLSGKLIKRNEENSVCSVGEVLRRSDMPKVLDL